jgi:hypothetical protein
MSEKKISGDMLETLAEFGHPIDIKLMAMELRNLRAQALTAEEREALENLRIDALGRLNAGPPPWGNPIGSVERRYNEAHAGRRLAIAALTRLLSTESP